MLNIINSDATNRQQAALRATTDEDLIESIAEGDRRAMDILFSRHKGAVLRFATRIVRDLSIAEDVVNEVFFDVWRKADRFEARSQVLTWLLAIARNKAIEALRRRTTETLDEDFVEAIEDTADDPEAAMRKKQDSEIVRECLSQLSADHRDIIDLIYFHERTIGEAAEMIRVPQNTVKTRMFYARKRLSELLANKDIHAVC
jgi:RNA polymerase sigma-70 factor, ECF subfamily